MDKKCSKCFEVKTLDNYHNKGKGFIRNDCKECVRLYGIEYRKINKESIKKKKHDYRIKKPEIKYNSHLKIKYGITLQEYNVILKAQYYSCAICLEKDKGDKRYRNLFLDHCHSTGKVRGLLCKNCNYGLGNFKDNIELFSKAIKYLQNFQSQPKE